MFYLLFSTPRNLDKIYAKLFKVYVVNNVNIYDIIRSTHNCNELYRRKFVTNIIFSTYLKILLATEGRTQNSIKYAHLKRNKLQYNPDLYQTATLQPFIADVRLPMTVFDRVLNVE